ncbi:MAG: UDP-glucose dehydrogenase family protein, partial [Devosia sp.]
MNIAMVGAGYVGLTTAACLAELGQSVVCADVDAVKIAQLKRGDLPIHEAGLDALVARNVAAGRLSFSADPAQAASRAEVVFLAVGTPQGADGHLNLTHLERAARDIATSLRPKSVVVVKSTVPATTNRRLREIIAEKRGNLDFAVASNPEFLREGTAVRDFMHPDRVVIGTDDSWACAALKQIYAPLERQGVPVLCTTPTNAELIKYAANSFLALKIGFINDVANLCQAVGADVSTVARGIGLDSRIGEAFLKPGPGFGGSCFPKDTRGFAAIGREFNAPQPIVEALIEGNARHRQNMARKVLKELQRCGGRCVAVLGLSFKAGTADLREAASLTLLPALLRAGANVRVSDPLVGPEILELFPQVDPYD